MSTSAYTVVGMTGDHCVRSVEDEVGAVAGVEKVDVDLATGRVEVTSSEQVDDAAVEAAVVEAGFTVS